MAASDPFRRMKDGALFLGWVFLGLTVRAEELPSTLILSWEKNPCTSMTAQWIRGPGLGDAPTVERPETVQWKKAGAEKWEFMSAEFFPFPDPEKMGRSRWTRVKASWNRLEPGCEYVFRIGDSPGAKFCTAPGEIGSGVTFVEGGDVDVAETSAQMMTLGARQDPLFISIGGDLAYEDGHDVRREIVFWQQWAKTARASDGRRIPVVAGIGNHEVKGGYVQEGASFREMKARAPFFYALFGGLYEKAEPVALDFGNYLSLLLMDSGHVLPIPAQTAWLRENLKKRKTVPWIFASWHVSTYPSFRKWKEQKEIVLTRAEWVPVLESSAVTAVFTHHDHNLQRVETEGLAGRKIPFLGNGAMGVEARPRNCAESEKLSKAFAQTDYVHVVRLRAGGATVCSLGPEGQELDRVEFSGRSQP
ncbi:MAG: metallophosphoesterase family protein [Verrucomicrobia bacterium]|nr:metallophosphoesterase family protein [Verrucomicrobiota bacterium]